MARQRIKGIGRFRRLLRRLPDVVRGEIIVELNVTGRGMLRAVRSRAPDLTGKLRAGLSSKVLPGSLRLQVGLIGTPAGRAKLFYGRIQDLGRKAQVVDVQRRRRVQLSRRDGSTYSTLRTDARGRKERADIVATYRMKVPAMEGKRFVTGRYPDLRATLKSNMRGIFARSLGKIAGGE